MGINSVSTKIRVAILDDHQGIIDGYLFRLGNHPRIDIVGTASNGEDLESIMAKTPVDVLLLDVNVPTSAENSNFYPILHVIPSLLEIHSDLNILVISMHEERRLISAVKESGANGYILKDDQLAIRDLPNIIMAVANGGIFYSQKTNEILMKGGDEQEDSILSPRQLEALSLCASYPNESSTQLAGRMSISHSTIRNLLSGAYLKLDVQTRSAAVTKARQLGIIPPPPSLFPH